MSRRQESWPPPLNEPPPNDLYQLVRRQEEALRHRGNVEVALEMARETVERDYGHHLSLRDANRLIMAAAESRLAEFYAEPPVNHQSLARAGVSDEARGRADLYPMIAVRPTLPPDEMRWGDHRIMNIVVPPPLPIDAETQRLFNAINEDMERSLFDGLFNINTVVAPEQQSSAITAHQLLEQQQRLMADMQARLRIATFRGDAFGEPIKPEARIKARGLLRQLAGREQWAEFENYGRITERIGGREFVIRPGKMIEVRSGDCRERWCVSPAATEPMPPEDTAIAQLLHLRADPDGLKRIANVWLA